MIKTYVSNAFLKIEDSHLYAIFAWSQRTAEIINSKSWLTVLEIFVHEHCLEKAYQIFQQIKLASVPEKLIADLDQYQYLIPNAIIFLADGKITIFGKGFRSFIEKEMLFELGDISQETYQVLPELFFNNQLKDDLESIESIENIEAFRHLVEHLEKLGLLSPATNSIDWGDLKKAVPICQAFGLTRGTPVDRYYLSKYLEEIQTQISGNILEIGGIPKDKDFYEVNPGTSYQIMNIEPGPGIDIVGDAHDTSLIQPESFDSIVIFNVLEHCYAPWQIVENIYTWLKPGGKCFAMVPSAIRLHATPMDYWRPLPDAFAWMFRNFSQQKLYVYGNPTSVIASYHGIAVEELTSEELDAFHPDYPVATCIVAEK
ncbi:class I SAM-dependent methyltransferase [Anabaena cylindrica FACHB-243]|nr:MULTISPECIES: methyltransferase domain-containing protein [Anabaena]MBD2418988.1 class I SAM-dependent methyltransferase [Anabaena cylindrica FACHB-243]MBY5282641.1 class I SAM-dependent methyltransferase [Anabaena sp. CCAP 1446/1C]MBY5309823.1 class I SAM-dependent methyltransferase [Anabaena sp. CCAP 1446/1C]MCM2407245.1 class I SAM-dependent methyltransferase [Anabaena sp. CCAP 1446/1C]